MSCKHTGSKSTFELTSKIRSFSRTRLFLARLWLRTSFFRHLFQNSGFAPYNQWYIKTLPLYHFQFVPDRSYLRIGALWRACDSADHHLPHDWDAEHFFAWKSTYDTTQMFRVRKWYEMQYILFNIRTSGSSHGCPFCLGVVWQFQTIDYLTLYEPLPLSVPPHPSTLVYLYWGLFGNYHLRYVRSVEAQGKKTKFLTYLGDCASVHDIVFPTFPEY